MAGTLTISTLSDGTNSTSATNCIQGSAKAWVNFNGSNGSIRASFNVSSVTRSQTGDYTVNFTTAMPDTNYCPVGMGTQSGDSSGNDVAQRQNQRTTTTFRFTCVTFSGAGSDAINSTVAIFR